MIKLDKTRAFRRFHEWHTRHDQNLRDMTREKSTTILGELSRSTSLRRKGQSSHPIWRDCVATLKSINSWQTGHSRFADARALRQMPYLPLPNRLEALKYLDPRSEAMPQKIKIAFEKLDLSAYLHGGSLVGTWWASANPYNNRWREENMTQEGEARRTPLAVARFLSLLKIVVDNGLAHIGPDFMENSAMEPVAEDDVGEEDRVDGNERGEAAYAKTPKAKEPRKRQGDVLERVFASKRRNTFVPSPALNAHAASQLVAAADDSRKIAALADDYQRVIQNRVQEIGEDFLGVMQAMLPKPQQATLEREKTAIFNALTTRLSAITSTANELTNRLAQVQGALVPKPAEVEDPINEQG